MSAGALRVCGVRRAVCGWGASVALGGRGCAGGSRVRDAKAKHGLWAEPHREALPDGSQPLPALLLARC